jgi:hypothetical protein
VNKIYYTGIGSRRAPKSALIKARQIAFNFAEKDIIMRSGGADGMDTAFDNGCWEAGGESEIYVPWKIFNKFSFRDKNRRQVIVPEFNPGAQIASKHHCRWNDLNTTAKKLLARNPYQILGKDLNTPSLFVVCWTPCGRIIGGTAIGILIARQRNIPVFNIALPLDIVRLQKFIKDMKL